MKSYLNNNKIENYQERQRWIDEHPNLLTDLLPQCKLIMCLVYHTREFENLSDRTHFFNLTFANLNRYMKLLEQLGFISGKQIGRKRRYCITRKGDIFVLELFKYFTTGHAQSQNSATQVSKADEHNISLKDNSNELSQISSKDETSLNNNIRRNSDTPLKSMEQLK